MTATLIAPSTTGITPRWSDPGSAPCAVATESAMASLVSRLAMPGRWATITRPGGAYEVRRVPGGWVVERDGAWKRFRTATEAARALWEWSV
ncbi:hypothetical protein [Demequina sp. NBRC 110057]|uniref:hypothetical protein n=1 Tax=Demequina sp. NBRC 110057 TaxID=1570346 RepID=UPI000A00BB00|nr:hypothetical protein [Demequina sp. NBRC 110057]